MRTGAKFAWSALRYASGTLLTFLLWVLWFGLAAVLVAQVLVLTRSELAVPEVVLRRLEAKVAEAGVTVRFDRALFDPTGHILVQRPRILLPGFDDPVIQARAAYMALNPLALLRGEIELEEFRIVDGTLSVPAVLSRTGSAEPVLQDLDATVALGDEEWRIQQVTGRAAAMHVAVHGIVAVLPTKTQADAAPAEHFAVLVQSRFADFCRLAMDLARRTRDFDQPALAVELKPLPTGGAAAVVRLTARGLHMRQPLEAELRDLHLATELPLWADAHFVTEVALSAGAIQVPGRMELQQVRGRVLGPLQTRPFAFEPTEIELAAAAASAHGVHAEAISARLRPQDSARWYADVVARVAGSELMAAAMIDRGERSARATFRGSVSAEVLDVVGARVQRDIRRLFDFTDLQIDQASVAFAPGWAFERLEAEASMRGINAKGIIMEEGRASIELTPGRLFAPSAYARIGPNYARGTYEHDFATREFRFLLDGRLDPLAISDWFQDWWRRFFVRFEFPGVPPEASVDVHGFWREGRRTSVFVFADAQTPVLLTQPFDRVRTRLFIRPGFYDVLELFATGGERGEVEGTFTVRTDMNSGRWRSIDVDARSSMPLEAARRMGGEFARDLLGPFEVARPPAVRVKGYFEGPAVEGTPARVMDLEARTSGSFQFRHFPLEDVAMAVRLRGDELTIDSDEAKFAGGSARLHAKVWGPPERRLIGFDASLNGASLGIAVAALQSFSAKRKGETPPPPGKFVREKVNVRIDVAASAEGRYDDPLSFHGSGNAAVSGPEIGEVPLFGPLSELLRFTALRFNSATTSFKINAAKLEFPDLVIRGNDAGIDAHGHYALDRRQLDFNAKVYPFQESGGVLKTVVGAVLAPISNVLEVKLTGSLEKPEWAFVLGPTNLIRSLAGETAEANATGGKAEASGAGTPGQSAPKAEQPPEAKAAESK